MEKKKTTYEIQWLHGTVDFVHYIMGFALWSDPQMPFRSFHPTALVSIHIIWANAAYNTFPQSYTVRESYIMGFQIG